MKKMNRREFLTLSGAAVVALSLAGCGGPSSPPSPPSPPASESKEMTLFKAINEVWYEVNREVVPNPNAVRAVRGYGRVFEKANETPHKLTPSDYAIVLEESDGFEAEMLKKYGENSFAGAAGVSEPSSENVVTLECEYSCEDAAVRAFVEKLLSNSDSRKAEFISIYLPVVQGKTYMTAVVFRNNKA